MNLQEVRNEFNVRYYLWAQLEADKEIADSFPHLQSFKGGMTWKMYQFMRQLDPSLQKTYSRALLKQYHAAAVKLLGNKLSNEEEILLTLGWSFSPPNSARENEVLIRREAGKKTRFASKRMLRASMDAKFRGAFGEQCLGLDRAGADPELRFQMKLRNWMVQTSFWFGRQHTLMSYEHLIASEQRISHPVHPEITAPSIIITLICWIGLLPIQWEYVFEDEVGDACDAVIKQCRQVFHQLPTLLDGLSG